MTLIRLHIGFPNALALRAFFTCLVIAQLAAVGVVQAADCNGNGLEDADEITAATVEDCNLNGIPDGCEGPPLAINDSASVRLESTVRGVVAEDLDGDTVTDFAVGYYGGISVRLGEPFGDFEELVEHTFVSQAVLPTAWVSGDVDGDDDTDLIAADRTRLVIAYNDGSGSFDEVDEVIVDLGGRLDELAVADLTGDGTDDIVVTNRETTQVTVVLTDGLGSFQDPVDYSVDDPRGLAVGDLDGDESPDIAVVNRSTAIVSILFNDGAGNFGDLTSIDSVGDRPERLVIADFSGDGLMDVATGDRLGVKIWLNERDRVFSESVPLAFGGEIVLAIGAGDLDGDADNDLVVNFADPAAPVVFTNDGTGAFNAGAALNVQFSARQIVVVDVDSDRSTDVVLTRSHGSSVTILWNRAGGNAVPFESPETYPAENRPHAADIGDLNGDGHLDLLLGNNMDRPISVMMNDGTGLFLPRDIETPLGAGGFSILARDVDGDLDLDIISGTGSSQRVVIMTNDGNANFEFKYEMRIDGGRVAQVEAGDLDGDGDVDVIAVTPGRNAISLAFNDSTGVLGGRVEYGVGTTPQAAVAADFDGDGDLDVAAANSGSSNVTLFENDGTGVLTFVENAPITGAPSYVVAGDMDLDGHIDVVTSNNRERTSSILWNSGQGTVAFEPSDSAFVGINPHSLIVHDLNGDDRLDIASVEETGPREAGATGGRVSIALNLGNRQFAAPNSFVTGSGPRFIVAGDIDSDLDVDVMSANRESLDVTVFRNQLATSMAPDFLESVCTSADYFELSVQSRATSSTRRNGKYVLAARDDPSLYPALFQNVNRFRLHEDFLSMVFPDEFGFIVGNPARYSEIVGRRATRDYFVGGIDLRRTNDGLLYTFNVVTDTAFDPREVLSQEETSELYDRLRAQFLLEPLAYSPNSQSALEMAETWVAPDFPVFIDDAPPPFQFEAYTLGLGYGRLRIMTLEEFEVANREGRFTFQDGVVIEDVSPPDIEGVVGFVFTGGVQGELAHLPIRTARRGTPNAFVSNVREKFGEFEGRLVRVEVFPENFFVTPVEPSVAEEFWRQIRRELPEPPFLDLGYAPIDGFLEMDLTGRPVGRYGGKATNLGRMQRVILNDGTLDAFLEPGFGIPAHYYTAFMQSNFRGAQTYEEYIQEIVAREDVRTDSNLRFELLDEFRRFARANGETDSDLVQTLALKIEQVFGDLATMVRFRSSSNVEDALVFNGAGLYESTSVCALDTLDSDERNSSFCDLTRGSERTIERALRKVWTSLWTFRAHEERTFYQIDPNDAVMGIAVTRAFLNEDANGVAFTGSPRDVEDKRYVITAQVGEGSVVSPPAGTTVERTILEVGEDGEVLNIIRSRASNQVEAGVVVMGEDHLRELARFMWRVENAWDFDLPEDISREQVLLDFEFKVEPDGSLAVKQVRPFLIPTPDLRTPTFELEIPPGTVLCGVFKPETVRDVGLGDAQPQDEYRFKSQIRLNNGVFELPTDVETITANLIAEVRFGPDQELAEPLGDGQLEFQTVPEEGSQTKYNFSYVQDFILPGDRLFKVTIGNLGFVGRGSIALQRRLVLDDEYNTVLLAMQAALDDVPVVAYSSCTYSHLPRWELDVELQDGSRLSFVERFEAVESTAQTGLASLTSADLELSGQRQVVRDYWRLVYASRRHNVDVVYWVVLDPELTLPGVERPVRVVELSGFDGLEIPSYACPEAIVRYLDSDFSVISSPTLTSCLKETRIELGPVFQRGDTGDGTVTIADAIQVLRYLFARGTAPSCLSAADANDDGRVDVGDAVNVVLHLFGGLSTLPQPFQACGIDPTPDNLSCESFAACGN